MAKNKRYKRLAKRIKGNCIVNSACCENNCKMFWACLLYLNKSEVPYTSRIRKLEKEIKNNTKLICEFEKLQRKRG
ncbi:MAG: hypothetical protein E7F71_13100 [Clostridium perfringens]|nr:hypothetical protein [Clostridium perfringens]